MSDIIEPHLPKPKDPPDPVKAPDPRPCWVRLGDQNFLTLLALALVVVVLLVVPQVRTIWVEIPTEVFTSRDVGWRGAVFIVYDFGLLLFFALVWVVIRIDPVRDRLDRIAEEHPGWRRWLLRGARFVLWGWWIDLAETMSASGRKIVGAALFAAGVAVGGAVTFVPAVAAFFDSRWLLGACLPASLALLLAIAGAWLWFVRSPSQGPGALVGRFIGFLNLSTLGGELVWGLTILLPDLISCRVYTIGAVFQICFVILTLAAVLDVGHEALGWPIRQATLGVLAIVGLTSWVLKPDPVGEPLAAAPAPADWYRTLQDRIDATSSDAPVILVAASGGGSRAAYFAALVYEALERQPLMNAQGEVLPAPRSRADKDRDRARWADQVILISSVSGGSLATAHHVRPPYGPSDDQRLWPVEADLHNSFGGSLKRTAAGYITAKPQPNETKKTMAETYASSWKDDDEDYRVRPHYTEKVDAAVQLPENPFDTTQDRWMILNRFGDDMCTDFMAPLLRGFMTPHARRGETLSRFWESKFKWTGCDNLHGYHDAGYGAGGVPPPLVLFNGTHVQSGSRMVIGFPPVPRGLFNSHGSKPLELGSYLASGREYHTFGLSDFDPTYRVSLAEAVRISANFPWGVRSANLVSPASAGVFENGVLNLLDGGVNNNTGIPAIWEVFDRLDRLARPQDPDVKPSEPARKILASLRRRGVIFLEIDSGAKPSATFNAELRTPAQGLDNAAYATAFEARDRYLGQLDSLLAPDVPVAELRKWAPYWGYMFRHTFQCNHTDYEVMTAWALPPSEKAKILATFFFEHRQWTDIDLPVDFPDWLAAWELQRKSKEEGPLAPPPAEKPIPDLWKAKEKLRENRGVDMLKLGK
jgi:hypothetical protein